MDPIFNEPSLGDSRQLNRMNETEREVLLSMSPMDRIGWAPESFRDGPWGAANDPQHPWLHDNVPDFLSKLGFGTVHKMPEIISENEARKLAKIWRTEVWDAFLPLNEPIRRNGDDLIHILANENVLPELELSRLLSEAWDKTKNLPLYKPLFGQTSVTENAPEGYRDYLNHWRGTIRHDCQAQTKPETGQTADKVSWTRPLLDVKVKEPQAYNDFVASNMLALTIPWLHTKHLLNRHTLWKLIMNRCCAQPFNYSRIDWLGAQLARSTHLVVPPYRDGWYMGFPSLQLGKKYWAKLDVFNDNPRYKGHVQWHALNVIDPGPNQLREPRIEALRDRGLLYGWGEGLLVLQCQGAIVRFLGNLLPLLQAKLLLFEEPPKKLLGPFINKDPLATEAEQAAPDSTKSMAVDMQERVAALFLLESVHLKQFETQKLGWSTWDTPDYRPGTATHAGRALMFGEYSLSLYKALAELRNDPLVFQEFISALMEAHPGGVPENETAAALWDAKMKRKKREKARKKRGSGSSAPGPESSATLGPSSATPSGVETTTAEEIAAGAGSIRVLGHITSTDIEAKKNLVNDVLRRGIRAMIYRLEISNAVRALFQNLADVSTAEALKSNKKYLHIMDPLPGPQSCSAWDLLLIHLRRFAEILKAMLVDDGLLHSSPWVRQNFRRETCNDEWQSKAAAGQSHVTPWALPTSFIPFEHRFALNSGPLQRDEQALVDDLQLLNYGNGDAVGFIGMWRVIHEMATSVGDMAERGYFESQNAMGLVNMLHHVLRWSRIMETIRPLRVTPQQYDTTLENSRSLSFFRSLNDFDFEKGISPKSLRDVQWLLGVRYADDDVAPLTVAEARTTLRVFWKDIDHWLQHSRTAPAYVDGLDRMRYPEKYLTPEEIKQAIRDGKADPAMMARRDREQFTVAQICGQISTLKPRETALPAAVTEPVPLPPAVIAATEAIESFNKRWIVDRYGDGAGGGVVKAPGRFLQPTNPNHEGHEDYKAKTRTRLTQTDWLTVERTFGHATGSVTWHDWCKLVTHMGFQMQPMGGSMFRFSYTSASWLPKSRGKDGWSNHTTIHMQHGNGNTALMPQVARNYATRFRTSFGVTRETIAAAYGTQADPDPDSELEDTVEEPESERKRNRKRKRQKEKFQKWLEANPPLDGNGQAREVEIPMAILDADVNDGSDDGESLEEVAGMNALDINAMTARIAAMRDQGFYWSRGGTRVWEGADADEELLEEGEGECFPEEGTESQENLPQEEEEEKHEDGPAVEDERPRKRVRFSSVMGSPSPTYLR